MSSVQNETSTRAGDSVRTPMDHHQCEALARRICRLLATDLLSYDERGNLTKKLRELYKVDHRIARQLFDRPLPHTTIRPMFFDDNMRPGSGVCGCSNVECWAGWVFRLCEYVERIETRYAIPIPPRDRIVPEVDEI